MQPDTTVTSAARELARRGVRRLVVVENGKLVGVVTMLGRLERKCEVEIADRSVPKIPGVIEVRNRLDHTWNDMPERHHV